MFEIITDSTFDLTPVQAEKLGVKVMPLTVHFGEESFRDGVDISNADFYARLREARTLPTTSQINPEAFASANMASRSYASDTVTVFSGVRTTSPFWISAWPVS